MDLGISLVYNIFCHLEKDLELEKKKSRGRIIFDCRSAHIRVKCNSRIHFHSVRQFAANELKLHWRSWTDRCQDESGRNSNRVEILTLWKSLVSVSSNLGYSQSKEFVASANRLVSRVAFETDHLLKLKQMEVLNEVLCYGSTLGIQSSIPCEVSDLAQELLRQAKAVPLTEYRIPTVFPGFGGNRLQVVAVDADADDDGFDVGPEEAPSLVVIQGIVLLHLKSSAIVVREAQCCSSSDSSASDSSLSSHGSR